LFALLVMIIRKMIRNRWLQLSLLFGLILSVALVGSIPVYTNAILQRMLIKDLESLQTETNSYPGRVTIAYSFSSESADTRLARTDRLHGIIREAEENGFGLPTLSKIWEYRSGYTRVDPLDESKRDPRLIRQADFAALQGLEEKVRVIDGRRPADGQPVDGVYEVLVTRQALLDLELALNDTYVMQVPQTDNKVLLKPVGVIDRIDPGDLYWNGLPPNRYNRSFLLPFFRFRTGGIGKPRLDDPVHLSALRVRLSPDQAAGPERVPRGLRVHPERVRPHDVPHPVHVADDGHAGRLRRTGRAASSSALVHERAGAHHAGVLPVHGRRPDHGAPEKRNRGAPQPRRQPAADHVQLLHRGRDPVGHRPSDRTAGVPAVHPDAGRFQRISGIRQPGGAGGAAGQDGLRLRRLRAGRRARHDARARVPGHPHHHRRAQAEGGAPAKHVDFAQDVPRCHPDRAGRLRLPRFPAADGHPDVHRPRVERFRHRSAVFPGADPVHGRVRPVRAPAVPAVHPARLLDRSQMVAAVPVFDPYPGRPFGHPIPFPDAVSHPDGGHRAVQRQRRADDEPE